MKSFLLWLCLPICIFLFLLMGTFCHASGTALEEVEERSYGFFSSRSDHVNEMLEKGFAGKASVLWNREQDYFKASEKRKDKECSQALSEALLKTLDPRVKSQCESGNSFVWPVQREQWHTVKQLLTDLDKLSQVTEKHMVLKYTGHQDSIISRLKQSKDSLVQQFTNGAADAGRSSRFSSKALYRATSFPHRSFPMGFVFMGEERGCQLGAWL